MTHTPRYLAPLKQASILCLTLSLSAITVHAGSGSGGYSSLAEKEIARRQARVNDGLASLEKGDKLFKDGDYEGALSEYKNALDLIPDAPAMAQLRAAALAKYVDASIELARQRAQNGRREEAKSLLKEALEKDPDNAKAKTLLKQLDDPERFNPALTPEHVKNVSDVTRTLEKANAYNELGDPDNANREFGNALRIDKYNKAARRGMETAEQMKADYYKSARDQTRASMLNAVNEGWESKVPAAVLESNPQKIYGTTQDGTSYYTVKMAKIVFPQVQFSGASIEEAIEFLRIKSKDLDTFTTDPTKRGVNLILKQGAAASTATITLDLRDVPMVEALKYITELAGMKYKIEPFAVVVVPISDVGTEQYTRTFKVPPDFLSSAGSDAGGGAPAGAAPAPDPFAAAGKTAAPASSIGTRATAKDILTNNGIAFPEGASAVFIPATSQLIVKNTQPNLDNIEAFVESLVKKVPQQIYITAKFIEVSQKNTDELGFDWLLGGFNINSSQSVFGSGGTSGNSQNGPVSATNFPISQSGSAIGSNPVTAGNRSGSFAVTPDSIDGLLAKNVNTGVAPGLFSLAGVFTDPQFQVVIRGLAQRKGVDLMSAPSVTTRSGQRAQIEVIREFRYPTEFNPPQIPNNFGGGIGLQANTFGGSSSTFPVTPTTPTAFEMRPVGVRMEVDPVLGPDGYTIDLNMAPEVTEFEGFVNYGSPIQSSATDALGNPTTIVLTENKILQPIFSTRKVTTAVTIWDGQTVAMGGLIREDVQDVEDKVPLLGDIPWIGRLFQTKAEDHFKRNLMIFVTAKLIDPSGQPIRSLKDQSQSQGGSESATGVDASGGAGVLPPIK